MNHLSITLPLIISITSCVSLQRPDPTPKNIGFQCLPVPSEWMEAGSFFEIDKDGISARIGRVDTIKVLESSSVGFPSYSQNSNWKIGFLISSLEKLAASTGWAASVSADISSSASVSSTYGDLQLDLIEGQPEPEAEKWFKKKGYKFEDNKKYYFVREAIKAKEVAYEIKSADLVKIGGEAKIKDLAQGKLNVFENKGDGSYKLSGKYPSPLNVCIKPREIVPIGAATGNGFLMFRDVEEKILIRETR